MRTVIDAARLLSCSAEYTCTMGRCTTHLGIYSIVIVLPALRAPLWSCCPLNEEKALTSDELRTAAVATRKAAGFMVDGIGCCGCRRAKLWEEEPQQIAMLAPPRCSLTQCRRVSADARSGWVSQFL